MAALDFRSSYNTLEQPLHTIPQHPIPNQNFGGIKWVLQETMTTSSRRRCRSYGVLTSSQAKILRPKTQIRYNHIDKRKWTESPFLCQRYYSIGQAMLIESKRNRKMPGLPSGFWYFKQKLLLHMQTVYALNVSSNITSVGPRDPQPNAKLQSIMHLSPSVFQHPKSKFLCFIYWHLHFQKFRSELGKFCPN